MEKLIAKSALLLCCGGLLAANAQALEAGDWVLRLGATQVEPREDSDDLRANGEVLLLGGGPLSGPGQSSSVGIDNDIQLGITIEYMLDSRWGIELLAATPFEHTATGRGAIQGLKIAEFKHLPPTLMAVYHIVAMGNFQPYVGAGLNYTLIFDEDLTSDADAAFAGLGLTGGKMSLDDSLGVSFQLGADYHLNDNWLINASARWIDIDSEAEIRFDDGTKLTTDIEVDPFVYTLSVGYTF